MPPETESDTLAADAITVQVMAENADLVEKYASGDQAMLSALQEKALALAANGVSEASVKNSLMRKLNVDL